MAENVNIERIEGTGHTFNFNFSKYEDYQKMLKDLEKLEKYYKRIPEEEIQERLECSQEINQQKKMIEAYKQEVLRLAETFSKRAINTERLKQAKAYFEQGKLREADAILKTEDLQNDQNALLSAKEKNESERQTIEQNLQNNANEFLLKAQLRATQFTENRMQETIAFYEQALASYRSPENLFEYAHFLQEQRQFKKAMPLYQEALGIYQKLAEKNPEAYLPDVAMTLNNLAVLLKDQGQFAEAKEAYQEALGIYQKLAEKNPEAYLPDVAMTLNNLAVLLKDQGQFAEAKEMYEECLDIRVDLFQKNQGAYAPDLAEISINYAMFLLQTEGYQDRDKSIQLAQQCILVGFPIAEQMPRVGSMVQTAVQILQAWGFDVQAWLESLGNK